MLGHPVFGIILLLACNAMGHAHGNRAIENSPSTSPEASTSLICPSADPSDCYPSIFQPTVHFQRIRPGQSIPAGLHVRLNIATGEKEARLNVPEDNEGHESAVLVIDNADGTQVSSENKADGQPGPSQIRPKDSKNLLNSETYRKAQKPVSAPRPHHRPDSSEASHYDLARAVIVDGHSGTRKPALGEQMDALADLTDLAHDLDWGVTITRDAELCNALNHMALAVDKTELAATQDLRSAVFLLLGTAIQNNFPANEELQYLEKTGRIELIAATTKIFVHEQRRRLEYDDEHVFASRLTSRAVFFLNWFLGDDDLLKHFLYDAVPSPGLSLLRDLFSPPPAPRKQHHGDRQPSESHQKAQIRIAQLLTDAAPSIASLDHERTGGTGSVLHAWCDTLSTGMEGRRKAFGRRQKSQLAEDTAFQTFRMARGVIAGALLEEMFDMPGACGGGSGRTAFDEMESEL